MRRRGLTIKVVFLALSLSLSGSYVFALPTDGSVVSGDATISTPTSTSMEIHQNTDRAIINWRDFSIGNGESTQFFVPGSNSATLNRVTGGNISQILGSLKSNGQLWIINQNGIMFGPNAQINTAGFVASTLNITNENFLKGNYVLAQEGANLAKIMNEGNITAEPNGFVALIAPQVENHGIIDATLGTVAIGAGQVATLQFEANHLLSFMVQSGVNVPLYDGNGNSVAAITHTGEIHADGGQVLLNAQSINSLLDQSINVRGVIQANTIATQPGKIILSSAGDTFLSGNASLSAQGLHSGETGGNIQVLGHRVALTDNASINTSGAAGGGKVMIGGDYRGENPNVQNAEYAYVGPNTHVNANATENGNGGGVVVWANNSTQFYGNITSQGGPLGGNGGFVETSGHNLDIAGGLVNTLAPQGVNGEWLLDPYNVTISSGATANDSLSSGVFTPSATGATVNVTDLQNALGLSNVTVTTTNAGGAEAGNIVVSNAVTYNGANSLTLTAAGTIAINAIVTLGGALNLNSGGAITQSAALVVTGITTIAAGSGNDITLSNASNDFSTVTITSGNNVSLTDLNALILGASTVSGTLGVTTSGTITQSGAISATGATTLVAGSTNDITLNNASNAFNTLSITSGKDVGITNTNTISFGVSNISNNLTVVTSAGDAIQGVGATMAVANIGSFNVPSGHSVIFDRVGNSFNIVTVPNASLTNFRTSGALVLGNITTVGPTPTLTLDAVGNITQTVGSSLNIASTTSLFAGSANDITLNNAGNVFNTVITHGSNPVRNLSITNTGALNLGAITAVNNLNVTSSGAITQSGALTVASGTTTLAAGSGNNITLNASNDFSTVAITSGNNVSITDANALALGASTVSGTLGVTTNGAITQSGALTVTGVTTLAAGSLNNITLNTGTNNFSTVAVTSGSAVTITDANALTMGAFTTAGAVTVASGIGSAGDLTQTGALSGGSGNIILSSANGGVIQSGSGAISTSGTVNVTASNGTLTLSGANNFTGALTLANSVTSTPITLNLNNAGYTTTVPITISSLGTQKLASVTATFSGLTTGINSSNFLTNATAAGNINSAASYDLSVTAGSYISALDYSAGTAWGLRNLTLTTAGDITLTQAANALTGTVALSGANVSVVNNGALQLGTTTTTGTFTANTSAASGAITQAASTALTTTGNATFVASSTGDITLNNAGNNFSTATITSGRNVGLTDVNSLILGTSTVSGTLGVTTSGAITQSDTLVVAGVTTLAAGSGNNITLNTGTNDFSTVGITSGNNVSLTDTNDLILGASTVSGTLGVTTSGAIGQSGALAVTGVTTLAAGSLSDIILNDASNNFSTVAVTSGGAVTVVDTNALTMGAFTTTGAVTVASSVGTAGDLTQAGALSGGSGNITLSSVNGGVIQSGSGAISTSGTVSVTATNGTINLVGANNFTGALTLANSVTSTPIALTLTNTGYTTSVPITITSLGTQKLSSATVTLANLTSGLDTFLTNLTTAGNINAAATYDLSVNAASYISALDYSAGSAWGLRNLTLATAGNITLTQAANALTGTVALSGANVSVVNNGALQLGATTTTGTFTANTSAASGAITQAASTALTTTGNATFVASSTGDITLNNAGNNFSTATITSGRNVGLTDINALILGTSTVSGTLDVTTSGAITQSDTLVVAGVTTLAAGSGNNITLNTGTNNFSTVGITSGNNVSLTDANALILGASTVSGTLDVTTTGAITQAASTALTTTGNATFAASSAGDITLNNAGNNFSTATITSGRNVGLTDTNALILGTSTVSGTLDVTTSGAITQSGVVAVTGVATLAAGSGNNITLTTGTNDFSTVAVSSGNVVGLTDANAITLSNLTTAGNLTVNAGGTVTQSGTINSSTANVVLATTSGAITQNAGAGIVNSGTVSVTATNGTINLVGSANNFSGALTVANSPTSTPIALTLTNTGYTTSVPVTITSLGTQKLSSATVTLANLTSGLDTFLTNLTTAGNINAAATYDLSVNAASYLSALDYSAGSAWGLRNLTLVTAGNITLTQAANALTGTVALSGANVSVVNNGALQLGATTTTGTFTANTSTAHGAITQATSTALTTAGNATFVASSTGDITLNNAGNNFSTATITSGRNVGLTDTNALTLGASTVSGTLDVTTNGAITQSGALVVTGITTLAAGSLNDITLNTGTNNFSTVVITSGGNVSLTDVNALILGTSTVTSTVSGTLGVTTSGAITQSGALAVTGVTTLAAGALNNITLSNASNNFSTVGITSGNNVSLTDLNALTLGTSTVNGTFGVTTNGAITQSGALTVAGVMTLAAGSGNSITLDTGANDFNTVGITSASNVSLADANAVVLGASTVSGNFDLTIGATGSMTVTQTGALSVVGTTIVKGSGGANVTTTFTNANNLFTGAVGTGAGSLGTGNLSITNKQALVLGAITAQGLSLDTSAVNGGITQTGIVNVINNGTTTIKSGTGTVDLSNTANTLVSVSITSSGAITLDTVGPMTISGTSVGGTATIVANNNNTAPSGTITVNGFNAGTNTVNITNLSTAIDTGTSAISVLSGVLTAGNLNLTTSRSNIYTAVGSGSISSSGVTTVDATGAGNVIQMTNTSNSFGSLVVSHGSTLLVNAAGALTLTTLSNTGPITILTTGALTNNAAISLTNQNVSLTGSSIAQNGAVGIGSGTLGLTATNGAITQGAGAITTANTTTVSASGTGNNITLDNASNDFATFTVSAGNNVTVRDLNALILGASTVSGNYSVTTGGAITQSGAINNSAGTTTLVAGSGNNITLTTSTNNFGTVAVTSGNVVQLRDTNAMILGASTISGAFTVTTGGALTQAASTAISATGGVTTLSTGSSGVTLTNSSNDFSSLVATTGDLSFTDANSLQLNSVNSSGNVTIVARNGTNGTLTIADAGSAPIVLSGLSKTLTLATDQLVNSYTTGAGTPFNIGANTWNIYITSIGNANNYGASTHALTSGNQAIWGTNYPTAIGVSGNRYIFGDTETLTLAPLGSPFSTSKTYGNVASLPTPSATTSANYQVSGFVNAATYGNVFSQDTVNNVAISGVSYTSTGTPATAGVNGGIPYAVKMTGTGTGSTGYATTYDNTATFGQLTVNGLGITLGATGTSVYGNAINTAGTYQIDSGSLVNGDTITGITLSTNATTASNVGTAYTTTASNAVFTGLEADNYSISYTSGRANSYTVTVRPITVGVTGSTAYGDPVATSGTAVVTSGTLVNSDTISSAGLSTNATTASPVGTAYTTTASSAQFGTGSSSNYDITYVNNRANSYTITARPITFGVTGTSVYGNSPLSTGGTYTIDSGSLVNSSTVGSIDLSTNATSASSVGTTYTTTASNVLFSSGGAASNYDISYANNRANSYSVTTRPITVGVTGSTVYGNPVATSGTAVVTSGTLVNSDTISSAGLSTNATSASPVGTAYTTTASSAQFGTGSSSNYDITYVNNRANSYTITARPITFGVTGTSVYGNSPLSTGGTYTIDSGSLVNGSTVGSIDLSTNATSASNVGTTYTTTASNVLFSSGGAASNYDISYANNRANSYSVTARPITLTPSASSVYGDNIPTTTTSFTVGGSGLVNSDSISAVTGLSSLTANSTSDVGTYTDLMGSGSTFSSGLSSNYAITYASNGTLTIAPRPITLTPSMSSVYGDSIPTTTTSFTVGGSGLANSNTISTITGLSNSESSTSNVGSYTDLAGSGSTFTSGSSSNYAITYTDGTLSITARPITVGVTGSSVYGNAVATSGTPVLTSGSLVNSNTISSAGLSTNATTASNVATNYTTTASSAVFGNGLASNYDISYVSNRANSYSITLAPLTITADNASKNAGAANPTFTATYTGFQNGQNSSVLLTPVVLTTVANTSSLAGNYPIVPSNATASNYFISFVNGVLTITGSIPDNNTFNNASYPVINQSPSLYQQQVDETLPTMQNGQLASPVSETTTKTSINPKLSNQTVTCHYDSAQKGEVCSSASGK